MIKIVQCCMTNECSTQSALFAYVVTRFKTSCSCTSTPAHIFLPWCLIKHVGASHLSKTAPSRAAVADRADWLVRPNGRTPNPSQEKRSVHQERSSAV